MWTKRYRLSTCRPERTLEQLEERVVLDGAIDQAVHEADSSVGGLAAVSDDAAQPAMWVWRTMCWVCSGGAVSMVLGEDFFGTDWKYVDYHAAAGSDLYFSTSTGGSENELWRLA